jgi:uncharacterized membrane protein YqjE
MKDQGFSRKILDLHFDLFGFFLGIANDLRPSDKRLNYYRALFSASVVDMFCGLNVLFSINNALHLDLGLETIYIVLAAIGIVGLNTILLSVVDSRYRSATGDFSMAPRVAGVSRWFVLGYAGIQIPWLFLNRSWHLMR